MVDDEQVRQGLRSNVEELQKILEEYDQFELPADQLQHIVFLQEQLSDNIDQIRRTIGLGNPEPPKKFSRTTFYSENSPYANKMDKSGSFRIVPPMMLRSHTTPNQTNDEVSSRILLGGLQLLENVRNLQRLRTISTTDEASVKGPMES